MASDTCAICLDEINMSEPNVCRTNCSHIFHVSCILKNTIKFNNKCPMCRSTIYDDVHEENADNPTDNLLQFIDNKLDEIDNQLVWHARKKINNQIRIYYMELHIIRFTSSILQYMIDHRMDVDPCALCYIALHAENWNLIEKIIALSNDPVDESLEAAITSVRSLFSEFVQHIVELNKIS